MEVKKDNSNSSEQLLAAAMHFEEEERAYWAQSVERDLTDIAEGKPAEYVSGDEFWNRFEQAAMKQYENVPA